MKLLATLSLLVTLSSVASAQDTVLDFDQAASNSVFVDVGGGVKTTTFNVTGNLQTLVFLVSFQGGNPVIQFVDPQGNVLGLDAPDITVQRTDWGVIAGLSKPALGLWTLQLSQTLGEGSYQVNTVSVPAVPTVTLMTPAASGQDWSAPLLVSGTTQPDQVGQSVQVMVTQGTETTGVIAGETIVGTDGSFQYSIDPSEFAPGTYGVVASLQQANGPPVKSAAPGTLTRSIPPLLPPLTGVRFTVEQPSNLIVDFTNPYGRTPVSFRLHVVDAAGVDHAIDLGLQTQTRIIGFAPGTAQARVVGVDSLGREGTPGQATAVTFGATPPVAPQLTLSAPVVNLALIAGTSGTAVFSLSGDFSSVDPRAALLALTLPDLPDGLGLAPAQSPWSVSQNASALSVTVSTQPSLTPGTYTLPLTFATVGLPSNTVVGTLQLQITAPVASVNDVSPNEWIQGASPTLTISGQNFGVGTALQIDGQEIPIASLTSQMITAQVPAALGPGAHTLAVVSNDGSQSTSALTVDAPAYAILAFKSVSEALAGGHARYWLGLQSLNGYTGSTSFLVTGLPSGWSASVNPPAAVPGTPNVNIVDVAVPASAPVGTTTLNVTTPEGGQVALTVNVVSSLDVFLSSMSSYAELAGASFTLYGYGFGSTPGTITVDNQTWPATRWSDDAVTVTVPAGAVTGLLRVKTADGRITNGITFGVKDYGFHMISNQLVFHVQGGDTDTVGIQLTGYQEAVNLTVQSLSPLVQASLNQTSVTPTGLVNLTLTADKNIPVGTYPITISGNSGLFQAQLELSVVVGSALQFSNSALPPALAGTNYAAQLGSVNAQGTVTYSLVNGALPQGITLNPSGLLSGRAAQSGSFRVVLQVSDASSHVTQKEYTFKVEATNWGRFGKDESQSWAGPVDAPADARKLWSSEPLGTPVGFLAGGNDLYLQTTDGIVAVYAATGAQQFRIPGSFSGLMYAQGSLFALDSQGTLHAWDASFGNEEWHRDNVARWWFEAGTVLAESQGQVMLISAALGTLSASLTADLSGTLFGWRGSLYRLQGTALQQWSDTSGWTTVYTDPASSLSAVSGDCLNLYVQSALGITSLWNGTTMTPLWTGPVSHLVVADQWLAVDTGAAVEIRDRSTGAILRSWTGGGYREFFASRNKLFGVRGSTLSAVNAWTGATIWSSPAAFGLLVGDRAAGADSQGVLSVYNAPDNLKPPVTSMTTAPASPDGANGWFVTAPRVSLSASDPETYAASTVWKVDATDWQSYQPETLTDGVHTFAWHSVDTGGLTEADRLAALSVDTVPPVSTLTVSPSPLVSLPTVWSAAITLTLSSQDAASGVAGVSYQINGGAWQSYTQGVTLTDEGLYSFAYRSRDQAGNVEAVQTLSLALDFHDPSAAAQVQKDQNATFVSLSGTADSPIGLDHLEYQVGSDAIMPYSDAIAFTTSGSWTLKYRAVDRAGRASAWQSLNVTNQGTDAADVLGRIQYAAGLRNREVDPSVRVGDPLFTNSSAKFASLPAELIGAAYLRGRDTDSQSTSNPWITVTFQAPATVYYLQDPASKAALTGWTKGPLIAGSVLSAQYFAAGLQEWSKTVTAGQTLAFTPPRLTKTGGDLILVQPVWIGAVITSPPAGASLSAGQTISLQAYTGPSANLTWTVQEPGRPPQTLSGNPVSYTVSAQADGGELDVSVRGTVSGQRIQDQASWPILKQEKLFIVFPSPLTPVLAGDAFTPRVFYQDSQGRSATPPAITWTATQGGRTVYQGASPVTIPKAGQTTLGGSLVTPSGRTVTATTNFTVVSQWPWVKWHWHDKKRQPWSDFEGEGFWGGPPADDDQRPARTKNGQLNLPIWKWQSGSEWRTDVDNGTYEIVMAVGPFDAWDVHTVTVNDRPLNVQTKTAGQVLSVRFIVKVTDGTLRIRGTVGMPFYSLNYRRTSDQTPGASLVGVLDNPEDLQ